MQDRLPLGTSAEGKTVLARPLSVLPQGDATAAERLAQPRTGQALRAATHTPKGVGRGSVMAAGTTGPLVAGTFEEAHVASGPSELRGA